MGFIRKALIISTAGLAPVKAQSYKERAAKAAEKQLRLQQQMLRGSQQAMGPSTQPSALARKKSPLWQTASAWSFILALFGTIIMVAAADGESSRPAAAFTVGSVFLAVALVLAVVAYRAHPSRATNVTPSIPAGGAAATAKRTARAPGTPDARGGGNPAPRAQAPMTKATVSTADEIERLARLLAQGALTDEEFAAAKSKVLGMTTGGDV